VYDKLYNLNGSKIMGYEPQTDKSFKQTEELDLNLFGTGLFQSKIINLPGDRLFVLGGASEVNCSKTSNKAYELIKNP